MNKSDLINKLIKDTISRAIRESVACLVVLIAFAHILQGMKPGTAAYFGCLLILVSTGFIAGVLWSFTLSYRLLRTHPASDSAFWYEAFLAQAKLLRLVPLWYLAPIYSGLVLMAAPTSPGRFMGFVGNIAVTTILFALIAWLNRHGATKIEEQAEVIRA